MNIDQQGDRTSEPCGKNPLMKPKDLYAPKAGIYKMPSKSKIMSQTWLCLISKFKKKV